MTILALISVKQNIQIWTLSNVAITKNLVRNVAERRNILSYEADHDIDILHDASIMRRLTFNTTSLTVVHSTPHSSI